MPDLELTRIKNTSILIVDDDERFRERLAKSITTRGYDVIVATDYESALLKAKSTIPTKAIVDLRMPGKHGLNIVRDLRELLPKISILVLTGYGSIATAVEAMRLGAIDYLTKPIDTDRILASFEYGISSDANDDFSFETPSLAQLEWEHIERVLRECNGNISKAARTLGMHRRTLQYKLAKLPSTR